MNTQTKTFFVTILLTVFLSCSSEDETLYNVDAPLTPYVDAFYSEASSRGANLEKSNLIVSMESQLQAITVIQKNGDQWHLKFDKEIFEEMERQGNPLWIIESYLYHELGKIILERDVIKTTIAHDSLPKSLMNPYYKKEGIKNEKLKVVLLDELFK